MAKSVNCRERRFVRLFTAVKLHEIGSFSNTVTDFERSEHLEL
jgi:hypothetical protein